MHSQLRRSPSFHQTLPFALLVLFMSASRLDAQTALSPDLSGDGVINESDLVELLRHAGSERGKAEYSATADLNVDGRIDHGDVLLFVDAWYGNAAPRLLFSGDSLLSQFGGLHLSGAGLQIQCAGGQSAPDLCAAGLRIASGSETTVGSETALPLMVADQSPGGATVVAYLTTSGPLSLLQADIAGPIVGRAPGPYAIPDQTVQFAEPVLIAPALVTSGSPFTQHNSMTLQVEALGLAKVLGVTSAEVDLEIEGTWVDCSRDGDWSYASLLYLVTARVAGMEAIWRFSMLSGSGGPQTVVSEVRGPLATTSVVLELVPSNEADFGELIAVYENPTPSDNDNFGWSIGRAGDNVLVGCPFDDVDTFFDGGASYLFDGLSGNLLTAFSNPGSDKISFGEAQTGIGNLVVVGSLSEEGTVSREGFAYLFDGDPASPTFGQHLSSLKNPNPVASGFFGAEVEEDGGLLAISAYNNRVSNVAAGRVYLYNINTAVQPPAFVPLKTIDNPEPSASDQFGDVVRFLGDGLLGVSGRFDDYGGIDGAGSVYIYDASPASPTFGNRLCTLRSTTAEDFEAFGYDFARAGNVIAVGIPYAYQVTNPTEPIGAVRLYDGDPNSPGFGGFLLELRNPTEGLSNELYGGSMASFGTVLAVGAQQYQRQGVNYGGAVHCYDCDRASPTFGQLIKTIENPTSPLSDGFGGSVINVNGDIVVAAMNHDQISGLQQYDNSGRVYRFRGPGK